MSTSLLTSPKVERAESASSVSSTTSPQREQIRLLAIGTQQGVTSVIYSLHRLGFANAGDWSRFIPAQNEGEVMSVLSKNVARR